MLPGAEIDTLLATFVAGLIAVLTIAVVRGAPRLAVVFWVSTIAFVPIWIGVTIHAYLPAASALAVLLIVALSGRHTVRLHAPDLVVALVVVIALLCFAAGFIGLSAAFDLVAGWTVAYVLGRLAGVTVDLPWLYGAIAVIMTVAGLLAMIEFVTGFNPFVLIHASNSLYTEWHTLQTRGGVTRAEGAFGHSIALGACLALALPLALGSALPSWLKGMSAAAMIGGAVVTFSRIGIAGTVFGLVLCIFFLRNGLSSKTRFALGGVLLVGTIAVIPLVDQVFSAAGTEATGSAQYRGSLLSLVPSMSLLGTSSLADRTADGVLSFGGYQSIDSALILAGLTYGLVVVVLLCVLCLTAVVVLLRKNPSPPVIALVVQIPIVATVALITQYAAFLWFIVGLAVSAQAARDTIPPAVRSRASSARETRTLDPSGHEHLAVPSPSVVEGTSRRTCDPA